MLVPACDPALDFFWISSSETSGETSAHDIDRGFGMVGVGRDSPHPGPAGATGGFRRLSKLDQSYVRQFPDTPMRPKAVHQITGTTEPRMNPPALGPGRQ